MERFNFVPQRYGQYNGCNKTKKEIDYAGDHFACRDEYFPKLRIRLRDGFQQKGSANDSRCENNEEDNPAEFSPPFFLAQGALLIFGQTFVLFFQCAVLILICIPILEMPHGYFLLSIVVSYRRFRICITAVQALPQLAT